MLIIFALTLNLLRLNSMLLLMVASLGIFFYYGNAHFMRLLKRLKWFYLVMFLIFLFNTPGEHIVSSGYGLNPTYEGLQFGLEQVLRITLMLAALSFMMISNTVQQLISGLYALLRPLTIVGLDVPRFAARLWLTLHYVEVQQSDLSSNKPLIKGLGERLNEAFKGNETQDVDVTLEPMLLAWLDYVAVLLMLGLFVVAFTFRGL